MARCDFFFRRDPLVNSRFLATSNSRSESSCRFPVYGTLPGGQVAARVTRFEPGACQPGRNTARRAPDLAISNLIVSSLNKWTHFLSGLTVLPMKGVLAEGGLECVPLEKPY